jgi:hypothetical protein
MEKHGRKLELLRESITEQGRPLASDISYHLINIEPKKILKTHLKTYVERRIRL